MMVVLSPILMILNGIEIANIVIIIHLNHMGHFGKLTSGIAPLVICGSFPSHFS